MRIILYINTLVGKTQRSSYVQLPQIIKRLIEICSGTRWAFANTVINFLLPEQAEFDSLSDYYTHKVCTIVCGLVQCD
jgi:hypothetical protein